MNDLSLRGIARRYGGITGGFSVVQDLFGVPQVTESEALRTKLGNMARQNHWFFYVEPNCIFGGGASFEQTWTHIRVRIRLNPDSGITADTMNTLRTTWKNGIENTWSNRWGCGRSGEVTCRLTFEVQWVASNEHHAVRVRPGPERSNMLTWDTDDGGAVAAHEFGHMLGHNDEYSDSVCPNRSPVNTGTVMDNNSPTIPARLVTRFADNIDSTVVALP